MSKADESARRSAAQLNRLSEPVLEHPELYPPVRVARVQQGITAAELADFAKVSLRTVQRADAGQRIGRFSERGIALALGRQREDLFT